MTKVSDNAKNELNKFGDFYFIFFSFMTIFCIGMLFLPNSDELKLCLLPIIIFVSYKWLIGRYKILTGNKDDTKREQAIKDYCDSLNGMELTKINENWINKDFTTARFAEKNEISEIKAYYFLYELLLSGKSNPGFVCQYIKINYQFGLSSNIVKIDKLNCLALLPDPDTTKNLLNQVIDFICFGYIRPREYIADYTSKQITSARKNIGKSIEEVVLRNYKKIFQILFSGVSFRIAGRIIKNKNGKKLLLITAIKTKKRRIVLLPEKTIVNIFENLNNICIKNIY